MRAYTTRRIINSLVTLLVIIIMNFFMFRLMPGDPIGMMVRSERLTPSMVARMERLYGVDKPLWEQFPIYVKNLLTFNLGISFKYKTAVTPLLVERMGNTIILLLGATILSIVLGTILG
ncbi:ABC transporter permease, partial [archaeon]